MYVVPSSGSNLLGGSMHALINGEPISTFYMLKMEGIYQRDDEVPAKLYAKGVRAGDVRYFDYNEDGDITDADRVNVGKAIPDFTVVLLRISHTKVLICHYLGNFP